MAPGIRELLIMLFRFSLAGKTIINTNSQAVPIKTVCLLIQFCLISATLATEPLVIDLNDVPWGPLGGGNGFPIGVRNARHGVDPNTGGITYYAMFPAGSHFYLHWHSHDE